MFLTEEQDKIILNFPLAGFNDNEFDGLATYIKPVNNILALLYTELKNIHTGKDKIDFIKAIINLEKKLSTKYENGDYVYISDFYTEFRKRVTEIVLKQREKKPPGTRYLYKIEPQTGLLEENLYHYDYKFVNGIATISSFYSIKIIQNKVNHNDIRIYYVVFHNPRLLPSHFEYVEFTTKEKFNQDTIMSINEYNKKFTDVFKKNVPKFKPRNINMTRDEFNTYNIIDLHDHAILNQLIEKASISSGGGIFIKTATSSQDVIGSVFTPEIPNIPDLNLNIGTPIQDQIPIDEKTLTKFFTQELPEFKDFEASLNELIKFLENIESQRKKTLYISDILKTEIERKNFNKLLELLVDKIDIDEEPLTNIAKHIRSYPKRAIKKIKDLQEQRAKPIIEDPVTVLKLKTLYGEERYKNLFTSRNEVFTNSTFDEFIGFTRNELLMRLYLYNDLIDSYNEKIKNESAYNNDIVLLRNMPNGGLLGKMSQELINAKTKYIMEDMDLDFPITYYKIIYNVDENENKHFQFKEDIIEVDSFNEYARVVLLNLKYINILSQVLIYVIKNT